MNDNFVITSVILRQRGAGNDAPTKKGEFYLCNEYNPGSLNTANWVKIGDFDLAAVANDQTFSVTKSKGRYLRVYITEARSGDGTISLSEIKAFGYQK